MGKIRIKTIGEEEPKKEKKQPKTKAHLPGMEGGQRIAVVGPTEEELAKIEESKTAQAPEEAKKKTKQKKTTKSHRSRRYKEMLLEVDRTKTYALTEALTLLPKVKLSKFDETVELHINTISMGISGQMKLPHGTGKATKVAIADDDLISEIEKGKISFDILVATPAMMPKLAKVAKILGPRGLMLNPQCPQELSFRFNSRKHKTRHTESPQNKNKQRSAICFKVCSYLCLDPFLKVYPERSRREFGCLTNCSSSRYYSSCRTQSPSGRGSSEDRGRFLLRLRSC